MTNSLLSRRGSPSTRTSRPVNRGKVALWASVIPIFVFLIAPSLVIVPMAFTSKDILEFPPSGFSVHTFSDLFNDPAWMSSIATSFQVAAIAVVLASTVGTLAAIGLHGARFRGRSIVMALILLPLAIPVVVLALGYFGFLARLHLIGTPLGIALGHSILATPYVYLAVSASLTGLNPELVRAAKSLGGGGAAVSRHVYLPAIRPGLAAGVLFAFTVSFDEVVISYFLQTPDTTTLPVKMFTDLQYDLTPIIAAVSCLLLLITTVILVVQGLMTRGGGSQVPLLPGGTPISTTGGK